jgi:DNA (cytosine-5)-methyltransferase 1
VAPTFIDLFSGCGGLSLGLSQSGWKGVFAIERATDAFETFSANFLSEAAQYPFEWPNWLSKEAHSVDDVLEMHLGKLHGLRGKIDLIAGGPPCQGFSFAGKRNASDPRNAMFERYVSIVDLVRPKALILENVPGMRIAHGAEKTRSEANSYYEKLVRELATIGYTARGQILQASAFGVPQKRPRLVVIGLRNDLVEGQRSSLDAVFRAIEDQGRLQLHDLGISVPVTAADAISDLDADVDKRIAHPSDGVRGSFQQIRYMGPSTPYQRLMNASVSVSAMDSMRLANHRPEISARFSKILDTCKRGLTLSVRDRDKLGLLKHRTVPMGSDQLAPTLTTLPDDVLHYRDPRILTVREYARIQSFPDSFVFRGKYTTGGDRRRVESPRYSQVGNAVPPLLARAVGMGVRAFLDGHVAQETTNTAIDRSSARDRKLGVVAA